MERTDEGKETKARKVEMRGWWREEFKRKEEGSQREWMRAIERSTAPSLAELQLRSSFRQLSRTSACDRPKHGHSPRERQRERVLGKHRDVLTVQVNLFILPPTTGWQLGAKHGRSFQFKRSHFRKQMDTVVLIKSIAQTGWCYWLFPAVHDSSMWDWLQMNTAWVLDNKGTCQCIKSMRFYTMSVLVIDSLLAGISGFIDSKKNRDH